MKKKHPKSKILLRFLHCIQRRRLLDSMVFTIFMNLIACGGDSFDRSSFVLDTKQSKFIIFGGKSKIIDGFKELRKHVFWMYGWIYLHVRRTSTFYFKSQFISDTYSDLFHYTYTVTHIDKSILVTGSSSPFHWFRSYRRQS